MDKRSLTGRLDWNLMRWFIVMVQEGSLSRAAAQLFVTQSAVSQALKRLEEQVGRKLIERQGHRFELTKAGENTYQAANDLYNRISRLEQEFEGGKRDDIMGRVSLMVVSRIHSSAYDAFLAHFHKRYPRVTLEISVMPSVKIISSLLRHAAVLGLVVYQPNVDKLIRERFLSQRWSLFCGRHHHLYGRTRLSVADLTGEDFVVFTSEQLGDSLSPLSMFRDTRGFVGKVVATSPNLDEIERLIFSGYGIGCLPQHTGADSVTAGRLWPLPPEEGVTDVIIDLAWHSERKLTPAEDAFITAFRQYMSQISMQNRLGRAWEQMHVVRLVQSG